MNFDNSQSNVPISLDGFTCCQPFTLYGTLSVRKKTKVANLKNCHKHSKKKNQPVVDIFSGFCTISITSLFFLYSPLSLILFRVMFLITCIVNDIIYRERFAEDERKLEILEHWIYNYGGCLLNLQT